MRTNTLWEYNKYLLIKILNTGTVHFYKGILPDIK